MNNPYRPRTPGSDRPSGLYVTKRAHRLEVLTLYAVMLLLVAGVAVPIALTAKSACDRALAQFEQAMPR